MVLALGICLPTMCYAQKKEISKAKDDVKAGKSLAEAEASMRKLLTDSANKDNEKIEKTIEIDVEKPITVVYQLKCKAGSIEIIE